jgi:hypothetical protein
MFLWLQFQSPYCLNSFFLFVRLLLPLASDCSAEEVVSANNREVGGMQEDWVLCAIDTSLRWRHLRAVSLGGVHLMYTTSS